MPVPATMICAMPVKSAPYRNRLPLTMAVEVRMSEAVKNQARAQSSGLFTHLESV